MPDPLPLQILVVHRGIVTQRDEVADVAQMVAGALETGDRTEVRFDLSDGHALYSATLQNGALSPVPTGPFRQALLTKRYDIALIHEPVPLLHLWIAIALRLRGTAIVHQPITMLGRDYARGTWFARRSWGFRAIKPLLVALLRWGWRLTANGFICVSDHEIAQSGLPPERCRVLRWPEPPTALTGEIRRSASSDPRPNAEGAPVAFVNRFDWHRKGFDRLCNWVEIYRSELPQPAVLLLAPRPPVVPDRLQRLVDDGLIEWHDTVTGKAILPYLQRCRALLLLSRWDGQSRILREAALAGIPTISTPGSHFSEIVVDLDHGLVVDGADPHAVHRAFQLAGHRRGQSGPVARKLFDRAEVGTELVDHLCELTGRQHRR